MISLADDQAHRGNDHSACGADTDCHDRWLTEMADAGEVAAIHTHTNERHGFCPTTWRCHQAWREVMDGDHDPATIIKESTLSQVEPEGGRVEAVVQHHMNGFVGQAVRHDGGHPLVLEVREGDILILPSHNGVDFDSRSDAMAEIAAKLGIDEVYSSRRISAPFILRKAVDE